jgi:hypothetical protein
MKDTQLWRELKKESPDCSLLLEQLPLLAHQPFEARFPFFSRLFCWASHDNPGIRAGVILCLSGCIGYKGFNLLVQALNDADDAVQSAAVEALWASCQNDMSQWLHALFHSNPSVRFKAVQYDKRDPLLDRAHVSLLEDVTCRRTLIGRSIGTRLEFDDLAILLSIHRRGLASDDEVRALVSDMESLKPRSFLPCAEPRPGLEHQRQQAFALLRQILELFWEKEDDVPRGLTNQQTCLFNRIKELIERSDRDVRDRIKTLLAQVADNRGYWIAPAFVLYLSIDPLAVFDTSLPVDLRKNAIRGLVSHSKTIPGGFSIELLKTADVLIRKDDGLLDLEVCYGILKLFQLKRILDLIVILRGEKAFIDSVIAHPFSAIPFLKMRESGPKADNVIKRLITEIQNTDCPNQAEAICAVIIARPVDDLGFLNSLPVETIRELYRQFFLVEAAGQMPIDEKLSFRITEKLTRQVFFCKTESIGCFVEEWIRSPLQESSAIGQAFFNRILHNQPIDPIAVAVQQLSEKDLVRFIRLLDFCVFLPLGPIVELAQQLQTNPNREVRQWALKNRLQKSFEADQKTEDGSVVTLSQKDAEMITQADFQELDDLLDDYRGHCLKGICQALASRTSDPRPSIGVCGALLACADPLKDIDMAFSKYSQADSDFLLELDSYMSCFRNRSLSLFGNSFLVVWDHHCEAADDQICQIFGGYLQCLTWTSTLTSATLRCFIFTNIARLFSIFRHRKKDRLRAIFDKELARCLLDMLPSDIGLQAAAILMAAHRFKEFQAVFDALAPSLVEIQWKLDKAVQIELRDWVSVSNLIGTPLILKKSASEASLDEVCRYQDPDQTQDAKGSKDPAFLAEICRYQDPDQVQNAALDLIVAGEPGLRLLANIITDTTLAPCICVICETVLVWPEGPVLQTLRDSCVDKRIPAVARYHLGLIFYKRGDHSVSKEVYAALTEENSQYWFDEDDWRKTLDAGLEITDLCRHAILSPQPCAYRKSIKYLENPHTQFKLSERIQLLQFFLECGTERQTDVRIEAAVFLLKSGLSDYYPIILNSDDEIPKHSRRLFSRNISMRNELIESLLIAGTENKGLEHCGGDQLLFELIDGCKPLQQRADALRKVIFDCRAIKTCERALKLLIQTEGPAPIVRRMAELCIWGVNIGFQLTGQAFRIEMLETGEAGYTRLNENIIYISPLPIVQMVPNAESIMHGIILHELGHHLYHKDKEAMAIHQAVAEDHILDRLLNLVCDEHLERRLQSFSAEYGDCFKHLAAHYFQHSVTEHPALDLLESFGPHSFEILTTITKRAGRVSGNIPLNSMDCWQLLEKKQNSFGRFFRALRIGQGNRYGDPKVDKALSLFKKGFKNATMADLLQIAKQLREIFGEETDLLGIANLDEQITSSWEQWVIQGLSIDADQLQREIERQSRSDETSVGVWVINQDESLDFDRIDHIQRLSHDGTLHLEYAQKIRHPALQIRKFLVGLGLRKTPQPGQLTGHRLDRSRLIRSIILNDPRVMIKQRSVVANDLFLAIVIDCSGSMTIDNRIEKAKHFGILLAEAAKGLKGVDMRLFGFNDSVIYDAGDADCCALHALESGGGNNDAAALWHVYRLALKSRRKARLLVMISDGSPTECSVEALRKLVRKLTGSGIASAQVAVAPLSEENICFPQYIDLDETDTLTATLEFGRVITRLVRKAMKA